MLIACENIKESPYTPENLHFEPENHPVEQENHLPSTSIFLVPWKIFRGVVERKFFQTNIFEGPKKSSVVRMVEILQAKTVDGFFSAIPAVLP